MIQSSFNKASKLLSSEEGEAGANRLLERLRSGSLKLEVRPNNYPKYAGQLEEEDYISYCSFLSSANGKKLLRILEGQDDRSLFKL